MQREMAESRRGRGHERKKKRGCGSDSVTGGWTRKSRSRSRDRGVEKTSGDISGVDRASLVYWRRKGET